MQSGFVHFPASSNSLSRFESESPTKFLQGGSISRRIGQKTPKNFSKGGGYPPKGYREMAYNFLKPCIRCGALGKQNLCDAHLAEKKLRENANNSVRKARSGQYSGSYRRLAKIVRETATACHICGEGFRPLDPFEADHLFPGTQVTDISQLAPAHRSCNINRGNKPLR